MATYNMRYVTSLQAGAPETTKGRGAASYLRAISGVVAGGTPPKFWAVGKSSSCQKFFVKKMQTLKLKNSYFGGNLGSKLKFCASMVSSVGHLQLSVEILWEIFSVCRKIANSCPAYFFNPRRR